MWLGIICACLSSLYNFFKKCFSRSQKDNPELGKPDFPAARAPNRARDEHPESAYYTGEVSNFSMSTVHERPTSDRAQTAVATV